VTTADALVAETQRFAADLTATVRAVVGDHVEAFRARALHRPGLDHVSVHQEPRTGIPLTVDGAPLLNLTAEYHCVWDSPGQFLAADAPSRSMPVPRPPVNRYSGMNTRGRRQAMFPELTFKSTGIGTLWHL
jgi:hypothetical protein